MTMMMMTVRGNDKLKRAGIVEKKRQSHVDTQRERESGEGDRERWEGGRERKGEGRERERDRERVSDKRRTVPTTRQGQHRLLTDRPYGSAIRH